jgi:DNA-directed RNA polymerase beta' subunit
MAWNTLVEIILVKNMKAWAVPGELVGIIAAQSIGEPATQMSCVYDTQIRINTPSGYYAGPIGKFIDDILENQKSNVVSLGHDSVVYDPKDDYYIPGVSNKEKTSWNRILQVSRHPANGGLVEVVTNSGRRTVATLSHSFLRRTENGIAEVKGSELIKGNRIPVASTIPEVPNPIYAVPIGDKMIPLDNTFGWICGLYLADGVLHEDLISIHKLPMIVEDTIRAWAKTYNYPVTIREYKADFGMGKAVEIRSKELRDWFEATYKFGSSKTISGLVYNTPKDYIAGVVGGYFDGDASVNTERQQIRISSRSKDLIQHISNLCAYVDVFGTLSKDSNESGYYIFNLLRNYADVFETNVGFQIEEKAKGLRDIVLYNNRDDAHSKMGLVDKIPELGDIIGFIAEQLKLPGCSRLYKRWRKKESIGRETLRKYIRVFQEGIEKMDAENPDRKFLEERLEVLIQAAYSDVVWDEIVELNYLEDPKTYVYDFTVPGNDSFMVDNNIFVHNTLNTFHLAGVAAKSNMTRGVPRLNELLKVTHNPKASSLTVYLKPEFRNNKDRVREVMQDLELTLLKDITLKSAIYYDPNDGNTTIPEDRELLEFYRLFEDHDIAANPQKAADTSKWLLRLEFDREKMFNRNITMDDVNFVLTNRFINEISTVYSDYNSTKLVMRIRLTNLNDEEPAFGDHLNILKRFQSKILNNVIIRGIEGIRAVTFRRSKDFMEKVEGEYKPIDQYVLDTDGSNYIEVMNHPAVDGNRIYSTNVHDVYEQLGIEATRNCLYTEISGLFEDTKINYRHLGILVDVMTKAGKLMSADRYGINKGNIGPLAKACFEETEKILLDAARFGEIDPVTGVSANIMTGQAIRGGTAFSQILLDEEALPRLLAGQPVVPGEDEDEEEEIVLTQENIDQALYEDENDPCSLTRLTMNVYMPTQQDHIEEDDIEITTIS